jgi:predicted nuclease with RNAse H fold
MPRADHARWAGVDVGGRRKGFDVAIIDVRGLVEVRSGLDVRAVVACLREQEPDVIGIDSPRSAAPDGRRSRAGERELRAAVCGIRYTPDVATLQAAHPKGYYEWILQGLALYRDLIAEESRAGWSVIEVFPTASWTRWAGPRPPGVTRAAWTRRALARTGLRGAPETSSQDVRDAIAAALTARLQPAGTECFGEIVVPCAPP